MLISAAATSSTAATASTTTRTNRRKENKCKKKSEMHLAVPWTLWMLHIVLLVRGKTLKPEMQTGQNPHLTWFWRPCPSNNKRPPARTLIWRAKKTYETGQLGWSTIQKPEMKGLFSPSPRHRLSNSLVTQALTAPPCLEEPRGLHEATPSR